MPDELVARYLEHICIDRYGALADFDVGPFGSGMNIVFGPNEAGKSTVASFVGGVLFGWEEAQGMRNTYRPVEGERSGKLLFADTCSEERFSLSRSRNEAGIQGDARLVADIDHATYRTMFSLSSDELRSLRSSSDVTARLLTAGSGTGSSPGAALEELERRIAEKTVLSNATQDSIVGIIARIEEKRGEVESMRATNELRKQEDRERANLAESRAQAAARLDEINGELESLHAARARIEMLDAQIEHRSNEIDALKAERMEQVLARDRAMDDSPQLVALDTASERLLRDRVEEYAESLGKAQRAADSAKENSASSTAAYEALLEIDEDAAARERNRESRWALLVVSVLLPVAFVVSGIPLLAHGISIRSLSFTALGIGLVVLACFMAATAFVVLSRPNKDAETLEKRRKDARWVMLQDKKKLDSNLAAKLELEEEIEAYFTSTGLGMANGSIRQARALLDEAREAKMRVSALEQRLASLDIRLGASRDALEDAKAERARIVSSAGLAPDASLHELDMLIRQRGDLRDELAKAFEDMNLRYGELDQRLEYARANRDFDKLKLEYQQLQCRLRESKRSLVTLLLAKRMLEKSIVAWESRSQPEVYANASRLFALLTDGAWTRIAMTGEGRLVAVASDGAAREVRHLSLGTCQQLYLSLRIAMLLKAGSVGAAIPVIADDILVNFDAARRRAAARALAVLSEKRQVIVFTCHRETVEALLGAVPDATYIEL